MEEAKKEGGPLAVSRAGPLCRDAEAGLELLDVDTARHGVSRHLAATGDLMAGVAGAAGGQGRCLHADLVSAQRDELRSVAAISLVGVVGDVMLAAVG
jgi:hypothetical protein